MTGITFIKNSFRNVYNGTRRHFLVLTEYLQDSLLNVEDATMQSARHFARKLVFSILSLILRFSSVVVRIKANVKIVDMKAYRS
jgi:hypothetical protein